MYGALEVGTSALVAQRAHLDLIAGNIAMREAMTRDASGEWVPYRRRVPLFAPGSGADGSRPGVHVAKIVEDDGPLGLRWDPQSPYAISAGDKKGYVWVSNVDYHTEMVNALQAARAYEANVTLIEAAKSMAATTLRLLA